MRRFLAKKTITIGVVVFVIVAGWWWRGQQARAKVLQNRWVVTVEKQDVVDSLTVSGKVTARRLAQLNFPVSGKLAFVRVEEGDEVTKGEWLMGLDTGDLKASETKAWYSYLAADANAKELDPLQWQ